VEFVKGTGPRPGTAGELRFAARCAATGAATAEAAEIGPVSGDVLAVASGRHDHARRVTFQGPGGELLVAEHYGCDEPRGSDRRGLFGIGDGVGNELTTFEVGGYASDPDDYDDADIAEAALRVIEENW
jgi:hypothetical protein